jgi:hypothetical protein
MSLLQEKYISLKIKLLELYSISFVQDREVLLEKKKIFLHCFTHVKSYANSEENWKKNLKL